MIWIVAWFLGVFITYLIVQSIGDRVFPDECNVLILPFWVIILSICLLVIPFIVCHWCWQCDDNELPL